MGQKGSGMEPSRWGFMIPLVLGFASFSVVFVFMSNAFRHESADSKLSYARSSENKGENRESGSGGCCRGIQGLELWGEAVKSGTDFKFNSSEQCCKACKEMCTGKDGPCLCNTWVFCGDKEACKEKFGECWLKKQKDVMLPEKKEESGKTMWTSGLVFGGGESTWFLFPKGRPWVGNRTRYTSHQASSSLLSILCFIYPRAVDSAPLCRLPFLSSRKSWPILGRFGQPHQRWFFDLM